MQNSDDFIIIDTKNTLKVLDSYQTSDLDSFVPQGLCVVDDYTLVTMYDANNLLQAKVVIFKDKKKLGETGLYHNSLVGGITYDKDHDIIWVTDLKGTISGYSLNEILSCKNIANPKYISVNCGDDLINYKGEIDVSYCTYYNNHLYVGNNASNGKSILKEFTINKDGSLNNYRVIKFIDYTQSVTFYKKGDDEYLLVSRSCGKNKDSNILIYKFNKLIKNINVIQPIGIKLQPTLEQIQVVNNTIVALYKHNIKQYKTLFSKTHDDIITYDLTDLIK